MIGIRSLLFVPGDRPDRMRKALASGADALILDLEDSVAPDAKGAARHHVAAFLAEGPRTLPLFVRINALGQEMLDADLEASVPHQPLGIMLPKAEGSHHIAILDDALGGTDIAIMPVVTETPKAIFGTGSYSERPARLCGLTWGAEDLSAALGASVVREPDGRYRAPYELARSLTLFGAHAAQVPAIETIFPNFSDLDGLHVYATRGREDGFTGMLAIHPSQIPIIHAAFHPAPDQIARAQRIVAAFAGQASGALSLDGEMLDAPHLAQARRVLWAAESRSRQDHDQ